MTFSLQLPSLPQTQPFHAMETILGYEHGNEIFFHFSTLVMTVIARTAATLPAIMCIGEL